MPFLVLELVFAGGIHMKKITLIISIIVAISFCVIAHININNKEAYETVKNEYFENQTYFEEIANLLLQYEDVGIQITADEKSNYGLTEKKVYDILKETDAWEYMINSGYAMVSKPLDGGVYFYRFRQIGLGRGVMYYPDGFIPEYNDRIAEYIALSDGWYFFAEE